MNTYTFSFCHNCHIFLEFCHIFVEFCHIFLQKLLSAPCWPMWNVRLAPIPIGKWQLWVKLQLWQYPRCRFLIILRMFLMCRFYTWKFHLLATNCASSLAMQCLQYACVLIGWFSNIIWRMTFAILQLVPPIKQARKPRSYASLKLRPSDLLTHSLTRVKSRATSVAKKLI